jgi:hypothetical protein
MQFVQTNPAMAPIIGDLIAKNMDWPGASEIAERLHAMLPAEIKDVLNKDKQPDIPPQVKQMIDQGMAQMEQMHAQLQEQGAELAELKSGHELKERELAIKEYEAETKRLQVVSTTMTPEQVAAVTQQTIVDTLSQMSAPEQMEGGEYYGDEFQAQEEMPAEPVEPVGLMPPEQFEFPAEDPPL